MTDRQTDDATQSVSIGGIYVQLCGLKTKIHLQQTKHYLERRSRLDRDVRSTFIFDDEWSDSFRLLDNFHQVIGISVSLHTTYGTD